MPEVSEDRRVPFRDSSRNQRAKRVAEWVRPITLAAADWWTDALRRTEGYIDPMFLPRPDMDRGQVMGALVHAVARDGRMHYDIEEGQILLFREILAMSIDEVLDETKVLFIGVDYVPHPLLLNAVTSAGMVATSPGATKNRSRVSPRDVLPVKTRMWISLPDDHIEVKAGYGAASESIWGTKPRRDHGELQGSAAGDPQRDAVAADERAGDAPHPRGSDR
jgi:hypothetical protein